MTRRQQVAAGVGVAATTNTFGGGAAAPTTAAVANALYMAPTGNDGNAGTSTAPFLTMDKCYQAASLGDTCYLKTGAYTNQLFAYAHRKAYDGHHCHLAATFYEGAGNFSQQTQDLTDCIQFTPEPGANVTVNGNVTINVPYVWLNGLTFSLAPPNGQLAIQNYSGTSGCAVNPNPYTDIVIQNNSLAHFFVNSVQYLSMQGNTFDGSQYTGTNPVSNAVQPGCGSQGTGEDGGTMYHMLFANNTVTHVFYTAAGQHIEGIHWWSSDHVDIDGNKLLDVCQLGISMQGDSDVEKNVLIQNNIFGVLCVSPNNLPNGSNHVLAISGQSTFHADDHFMVRFNSCPYNDYCPTLYGADAWPDFKITANIMGATGGACGGDQGRGGVFDYNFFFNNGGQTCGSNSKSNTCAAVSCVYADAPNNDYSIQAGLAPTPIDMVSASVPGGCPPDINGTPRPVGANCDAGAVESGGGAPPPPPPPPPP